MRTNVVIRLAAVVFIALSLFVIPQLWHWNGLPLTVLSVLFILTIFLVRWHARNTGYQCMQCSHTFSISPTTDFLSPHLGGIKMLCCPKCGRSSWCTEIGIRDVTDTPPEEPATPVDVSQSGTSLHIQIALVHLLYLGLWVYTLLAWPVLPEGATSWTVLKIPLVTFILPVLQITFCFYALRHGYRSRIYLIVSLFVIFFLGLALWMQKTILTRM